MSFRNSIEVDFQQAVKSHRAGNVFEAEKGYRRVLTRSPRHVFALNNLGLILSEKRDIKAIDYSSRAAENDSSNPETWLNLARIAGVFRKKDIVDKATRRAVELAPNNWDAVLHRARSCFDANQLVEGLQRARRACELNPTNPSSVNMLATMLYRQGFLEEAIDTCEKAMAMGVTSLELHSAHLFYQHFSSKPTLQNLHNNAVEFGRRYADPVTPDRSLWPKPSGPTNKRLKVGFISCDFCSHPVTYFFLPLLAGMKPEHNWDFIAYHTDSFEDEMTDKIRSFAKFWRNVTELSDGDLADVIRQDEVDILFDLNGHTGVRQRLLTFARKPAPVQVTWLGYFDTTGVKTIDYILADRFCIRPEDEHFYVEKVAYMPDDFLCYSTPVNAPPVAPLPALKNNHFTFGSANQITKITEDVIDLWCDILKLVPGSRLRLKTKALGDPETVARYKGFFEARGVADDRIDLLGPGSQRQMFEFYRTIDLGLDPFPCAGGTTTCEALWSGVPVVSLIGERFCGRHSGSHMIAAGLPQFGVADRQTYLEVCKIAASEPGLLAQMRSQIRSRMAISPLMNPDRFAQNFAGVLRHMWTEKLEAQ